MPPSHLPATVSTADDVTALDDAARRFEVPCGAGTMVWRQWGEGDPVVLLHGGSGSWTHWVRNIAALVAGGRSVWVPDLPGFGESAAPRGAHDADALLAPVEAAARELLGAPFDLVGFSFGSIVAALIAADSPESVRRLVVVGAPALGVPLVELPPLQPWRHLHTRDERDAAHRYNLGVLMLADADSISPLAILLQATNAERDRMRRRKLSRTDIVIRSLERVRCPVAGIWGARDALYVGRTAAIEPALRALPHFRSVRLIEGAGHWVQFEDSAAFDATLAQALG